MATITNRDKKYNTVKSVQGGLYDVVIALKQNIMKSLNVATFAKVQTIDLVNQTAIVTPFPLVDGENEKNIECFATMIPKIENDNISWISLINNLTKGDIVIIVFTNRNSKQTLVQAKKGMKLTSLTENSNLHSDTFGIIIGMMYKATNKED